MSLKHVNARRCIIALILAACVTACVRRETEQNIFNNSRIRAKTLFAVGNDEQNEETSAELETRLQAKDSKGILDCAVKIERVMQAPRSYAVLRRALQYAADELQYPEAMARLAIYLRFGLGGPKDQNAAIRYTLAAINKGCSDAYYLVPEFAPPGWEAKDLPGELEKKLREDISSRRPAALYLGAIRSMKIKKENERDNVQQLCLAMDNGSALAAIKLTQILGSEVSNLSDKRKSRILISLSQLLANDEASIQNFMANVDSDELERVLREGAYWACGPAALAIAKLELESAPVAERQRRITLNDACYAFALGAQEACFYIAGEYIIDGDLAMGDLWLNWGTTLSDWRCEAATRLQDYSEIHPLPAVENVLRMSYKDYSSLMLKAQAGGNTTPPAALTMQRLRLPGAYVNTLDKGGAIAEVAFTIGLDGIPIGIKVTRCEMTDLEPVILSAVKGWRFTPAMRMGKAIPCIVRLPITLS